MENFWVPYESDKEVLEILEKGTGLPNYIVSLLYALGIRTVGEAERFMKPSFKQLHNPTDIKDMQKAVKRISDAIDAKEKILLHGDYDADGVNTIAVGIKAFRQLGLEIDYFAPNRFNDGYGLNPRNMEKFAHEYDLIITGDTGIRAFEGAEVVRNIGKADLIITDHHEPFVQPLDKLNEAPKSSVIIKTETEYLAIPHAYAVIDPHRIDDPHPCKTHAGVGVLFKTMLAVFRYRNEPVQPLLNLLDLVATGTIADLAHQIDNSAESLDFEVRVMCTAGIQIMNENPAPWVSAIKHSTGLGNDAVITSESIGFIIGPTLNAVGRLYDPAPAVEILLEEDLDVAIEKAIELTEINKERQNETKTAYSIIDELKDNGDESRYDYGIVVHSDSYGEGIAGLVSEKLKSGFYRPAIALTTAEKDGKTIYKGSGRSIPGVHILHMLDEVQREIGPFVYGGHEMAAGMSIEPSQFEPFQKAFRKACMNHAPEVFVPTFQYQSTVNLEDIDDKFMNQLAAFEPFGEGNKKPTFRLNSALVASLKPHSNGKGFNLTLQQGRNTMKALSFNLAETFIPLYKEELREKKKVHVDILFQPSYNEFRGIVSRQLNIKDIKLSRLTL